MLPTHFKRFALIVGCLVMMIGSGGCLTTLGVMVATDAVMTTKDSISDSIHATQQFKLFITKFQALKIKVDNHTATAQEYLDYAHYLDSYWVRDNKVARNQILVPNRWQQYEAALQQSATLGNEEAKKELFALPIYRIFDYSAENLRNVKIKNTQQSKAFDNYIQQQLFPLARSNAKRFCEVYPFNLERLSGIADNNMEILTLSFSDYLQPQGELTVSNTNNVRLTQITQLMLCSSSPEETSHTVNNIYMVYHSPEQTYTAQQNQLIKDRLAIFSVYGAYAILTKNDEMMQKLVDKIKESHQEKFIGEFTELSQQLADNYKQANLPLNR